MALGAVQPAWAEMHALLVGVSAYPSLPEHRLSGPRNDVQRMKAVLAQRGFAPARITVLADGVPGAKQPTRSVILQALESLARSTKTGDTVLLYFAGHGSQQPVVPGSSQAAQESDGWHEIFLPIDIGSWDGQRGGVKNAIVDHELRAAVDKIQDRGAFVWGVFDTCHSATLVRSAGDDEVRYRAVPAQALGVPQQPRYAASAHAVPANEPKAGRGQAVFFYAAQTTEQTPEMKLPQGARDRRPYGLFSFMLSRALELGSPMTYRQMGQYVLAQYAGINEARATPLFTGTGLDQPVLGQASMPVRQWSIDQARMSVPVGALAGVSRDAVFAVLPSPVARDSEVIGYLRATDVQLGHTALAPLAYGGKPLLRANDIKPTWYARLASNPQRRPLRVTVDASDCGQACAWLPMLDQVKRMEGAAIEWVGTGSDLTLQLRKHQVLALSSSEASTCRPGASKSNCGHQQAGWPLLTLEKDGTGQIDQAGLAETLSTALRSVARTTLLLRLSAESAASSPSSGLPVSIATVSGAGKLHQPITAEKVAELRAGDLLKVALGNNGPSARDVTVLYLDARHGIQVLFPREGESNRLEAGALQSLEFVVDDSTHGIERLLVISVEAERLGERADFSFLAQPSLTAGASDKTRAGAAQGAGEMQGSKLGMQMFTFRVK